MIFAAASCLQEQPLAKLASYRGHVAREMDELVSMNRTFKMLMDQGFVYELMARSAGFPDSKVVAGKFFTAFKSADVIYRTIPHSLMPNQRGLVFSVGLRALLQTFECRFVFNPFARCSGVSIEGGDQRLFIDGESFHVSGDYLSHIKLSILRSINIEGEWIVAPACSILTPGGAPAAWTQFNCKFLVERDR